VRRSGSSNPSPYAVHQARTIVVPPIVDDDSLAVFAHEGGHLEDPDGHLERTPCEVTIASEVFAWTFAMRSLGRRWTPACQACMKSALRTYLPGNVTAYHVGEIRLLDELIAVGAERVRKRGVFKIQ
jgi:hypothetical protein